MPHVHEFLPKLTGILNTGRSRSVMLYGNVYDLFNDGESFVPLVSYLSKKCAIKPNGKVKGVTQVIYQMDRDIEVVGDREELAAAWDRFMALTGRKDNTFEFLVKSAKREHAMAIDFLRHLTMNSEELGLKHDLLVIIEGIESLIPFGNFAQLGIADRTKIGIMSEWFRDPKFTNGKNSVILIGESRGLIHDAVGKLPQLLSVEVPAPNAADRAAFIEYRKAETDCPNFVEMTAGLSIHALRQLLCTKPTLNDVVAKVEEYIQAQLGEDVVEFQRPTKTLKDVVGFTALKRFLREELIPWFQETGDDALSGAAVAGPIGGGKTFVFAAMCAELGIPILVLKNLRSMYFGQTDVIFEKLRRVLLSLGKVCISVDEADTMFGGLGSDVHETEKRLTAKIQQMMSAPELRGKVIWLLMTARIHKLSPDIRRPGRAGDLIIPVLDPEGADAREFREWCVKVLERGLVHPINVDDPEFVKLTEGYSAASYQALRARLKKNAARCTHTEDVVRIVKDIIPADIGKTRRYQILQALINCTSRSLLPEKCQVDLEMERESWRNELQKLEAQGVG